MSVSARDIWWKTGAIMLDSNASSDDSLLATWRVYCSQVEQVYGTQWVPGYMKEGVIFLTWEYLKTWKLESLNVVNRLIKEYVKGKGSRQGPQSLLTLSRTCSKVATEIDAKWATASASELQSCPTVRKHRKPKVYRVNLSSQKVI